MTACILQATALTMRGGTRTSERNGRMARFRQRPPRNPSAGRTSKKVKQVCPVPPPKRRRDKPSRSQGGKPAPRSKARTAAVRQTATVMRLNKFLAEAGIASRRKADELITSGVVAVNGRTVTELGVKVDPGKDAVTVSGAPVSIQPRLVYILLNKPKDCITTAADERGRRTVLDLVPHHTRLYPVGRLDRNTTGVLLLTNDGDLAYRLTHPSFRHPRVYRVRLERRIRTSDLAALRRGVVLEDGMTAPCEAEIIDRPENRTIALVIHEGRNRQVRRMFESLGYEVKSLERVAFAGLTVQGLKRGAWRYLEEREIDRLRRITDSPTLRNTRKNSLGKSRTGEDADDLEP
ncbi:MAG: pseudouridine synthase [Bacteroidota bacterium]|nr:pseudouridine synthase [Bacteroidota bacterium]